MKKIGTVCNYRDPNVIQKHTPIVQIIDDYLQEKRTSVCGHFILLTERQGNHASTVAAMKKQHFVVPDTDERLFVRENAIIRIQHYSGKPFFMAKNDYEEIFSYFTLRKRKRIQSPSFQIRSLDFPIEVDETDTDRTPVTVVFEQSISKYGNSVEKCILRHDLGDGFYVGWEQKRSGFTSSWKCIASERRTYKEELNCGSCYTNESFTWKSLRKAENKTIYINLRNAKHGSLGCVFNAGDAAKFYGPRFVTGDVEQHKKNQTFDVMATKQPIGDMICSSNNNNNSIIFNMYS